MMDLLSKGKSFNIVLVLYFALLPFVFFSSILDPFLLARQFLTTIFLFSILYFLFQKKNVSLFTVDKTALFFLGFIVFCGLSFSQSLIPDLSHAVFSKYLLYLLFFLLLRHLMLNDLITVRQIGGYVIGFGLLAILIAFLAFISKDMDGQHLFRGINSISGTFANKNFLSSILFFCLPFYFIGLSISDKMKTVAITAIILTIGLLLILRTRTVLIALGVYLFLVFLLQLRTKFSGRAFYWFLAVPLLLVGLAIAFLFSVKSHLHSSADIKIQYFYRLLSSETLLERLEFWQQAVYVIKDNLFGGIGVGNWMPAYPRYGLNHFSEADILNGRMIISNPHNDFLMVLSEIGIFGFLCYAALFILMGYQAFWLAKNEMETNNRKNACYLLFFVISYLIVAFFDFPITRIEHQILLLTAFAMISNRYLKARKVEGFKIPARRMYLISCILLMYCIVITVFRINGERHLFLALEAEKQSDNPTAIFEFNKAKNLFFSTDNYAMPLDWHIGKAQYNAGEYSESLDSFQDAYTISPYNIVVSNDLGSTYVKSNDVASGIKHYKDALAISPRYEDALINLAATYYNENNYEAAFQTIDQCSTDTKNKSYRQILLPIVEKKLNATLIRINNTELNIYLKSKITSENALWGLYFDYKKNNVTFDKYILSLIH